MDDTRVWTSCAGYELLTKECHLRMVGLGASQVDLVWIAVGSLAC